MRMKQDPFSLILLPTLECNADCDYCFEKKGLGQLSLGQLSTMVRKVMAHTSQSGFETLFIYWQGGEVMTLTPEWIEEAFEIIQESAAGRGLHVVHYLQSNMIAYNSEWNRALATVFGNSVGSSMDYPNLHRKLKRGGARDYTRLWERNIREAIQSGIQVGVISIPNEKTLKMGAERFYSYFTEELGIVDFQINTPFPGGAVNDVKTGYPLDSRELSRFLNDLAQVWMQRGFHKGVRIGPFDRLMNFFVHDDRSLLCIWRDNCANDFICIDPAGHIAQCDCWVTSYPAFRFGNIFDNQPLSELLEHSTARGSFLSRPGTLMQREDCLECDYLTLCHGGCPVRAYSVHGDLLRKDPYCEVYRNLFRNMEALAAGRSSVISHAPYFGPLPEKERKP